MDVSAIGAYNPNRINWQNLTAKQIMKFHDAGVEVPSVYYKWAQDFINSVNSYSQDEVTYERAVSESAKNKEKGDAGVKVNTDNEAGETSAETDTDTEVSSESEIETKAAEESDSSSEDNEPDEEDAAEKQTATPPATRSQVLKLTAESKAARKDVGASVKEMNSVSDASTSELQALENDMQALFTEAEAAREEFKAQIRLINDGKAKNNTVDKIYELQDTIKGLGDSGYQQLANFETNMADKVADVQGQEAILSGAADKGAETIEAGTDLLNNSNKGFFIKRLIHKIVAKLGIAQGGKAIDAGTAGMEVQNASIQNINSNLASSVGFYSEIEDRTGVAAPDKSDAEGEKDSSTKNSAGEKNEKDKEIKTSQNDGTDQTDKQNVNIDEILKRKVRKGIPTEG